MVHLILLKSYMRGHTCSISESIFLWINLLSMSITTPVSSSQSHSSNNVTPTKQLGMHTECIDQLSKWHALLQNGMISNEQYEELKGVILKDMSVDLTKQ